MEPGALKLKASILAAVMLAGCEPAYALDVVVQAGTAISNIQLAISATTTAAPPHTITVMPGWYPLFDNTKLTSGVIRSISGELNGYGSATDTLCGTNAGGTTALYVPSASTIQGIGFTVLRRRFSHSGAKAILFKNCRFTDIGRADDYGGIGNALGSFIGCEFIRCIGLEVLLDIPLIANSVFIGCEGFGSYASIVRTDNNSPYLLESCTFSACKVAGNRPIIDAYGGVTNTTIRNNIVVYTNNAWTGANLINAGGNVSNGATFFSAPTGYGTNATISGTDLRLVPGCAAFTAGVFTNAARYNSGTNTAYDVRGMNWRVQTNNASGAYWLSPLDYPQFFGGMIL